MLRTERDLFEIDHCAAGAYLAQDWDFPDELAAALANHHDPPVPGEMSLDMDLGGTYPLPPRRRSSWLRSPPEVAKAKFKNRLDNALY